MPNERESFIPLDVREYDIAGNLLRAFVNPDGDIVFVLDLLIDENKPNVLLIIDSYDNRKWDDVLENDYGVDLETVRPKKDNKYQDINIAGPGFINITFSDKELIEHVNELKENINLNYENDNPKTIFFFQRLKVFGII